MAFKIFKGSKAPELIEYKKYIEYLKEMYLSALAKENGTVYQNYRAMAADKKERFLDEYAKTEIKKLVDLFIEKDEEILNIIKQELLNSYTNDVDKVEKLMEELECVSKNAQSEQKNSANNHEVKPPKEVLPSISAVDEKSAMFMRLKANRPVVDKTVKYGLITPGESSEKSILLNKTINDMEVVIALMDLGTISEEEKQQLLYLANKIIIASGVVNRTFDLNAIKELMELGATKDWQIKELSSVLDKIIAVKRNEAEEKLTIVINKIAEKKEKELNPDVVDSGMGI